MTNPPSDQGIPVLTEVISPDLDVKPTVKPVTPPAIPSAAIPSATATPAVTAPGTMTYPPGAFSTRVNASSAAASQNAGATHKQTPPPSASPELKRPAAPSVVPPLVPAMPAEQAASNPDTMAGTTWNDDDWSHLESELRQRITRQVLGRIDFVLDHRVRSTLTDVIDNAIDGLATEIKHSLHATLTDMVARAVAQEIARIQPPKK